MEANDRPWRILACSLVCGAVLAGCGKPDHAEAPSPASRAEPGHLASAVPAAGANEASKMPVPPMPPSTPEAIAAGHALYVKMNCAGCHSYTAKGWMGPDLTDSYWRYGKEPADIYRTIFEGRPQGMPAWGEALPTEQIWDLVHYIRSLPTHPGGDPTTVSPATDTGIAVDALPPQHGAAK